MYDQYSMLVYIGKWEINLNTVFAGKKQRPQRGQIDPASLSAAPVSLEKKDCTRTRLLLRIGRESMLERAVCDLLDEKLNCRLNLMMSFIMMRASP